MQDDCFDRPPGRAPAKILIGYQRRKIANPVRPHVLELKIGLLRTDIYWDDRSFRDLYRLRIANHLAIFNRLINDADT